jgi:uncharacterized membrane protein YfcA
VSTADVIGAVVAGFAAGVTSGLLGVGGGVLFVPALVLFLGLTQLHAEATSLLAVVPVAAVGAWRQHHYGNVRMRDGIVVGLLSPLGVFAGVELANALPDEVLKLSFAVVQLYFAYRLGRRALAPSSVRPS